MCYDRACDNDTKQYGLVLAIEYDRVRSSLSLPLRTRTHTRSILKVTRLVNRAKRRLCRREKEGET